MTATATTAEWRANAEWRETLLAATTAALVLLAVSWPAFHAYFFGEAFLYLGQYWAQRERFWPALLGPSDVSFFKPVCFAASLPWYFLLPPDPVAYQIRNFAFTVVDLALLHRVLLRLVRTRAARASALLLFAGSKVHLTTIGYVMIFDSIVMLGLLLLAVLYTLRWCATRGRLDAALALVCAGLCAFTKDYGVAVVLVLAATVATGVRADPPAARRRALGSWGLALATIAAVRIGLRQAFVGALPWAHESYAPAFSLGEIGRKGLVFASALTNTSFGWHDKTGAAGWGSLAADILPTAPPWTADAVDAIVGAAVALIVAATIVGARRQWRAFALPLAWIAAFFAPPLLVRNVQIYYAYEPLAGFAVLFGVALAELGRAWQGVVAGTVAVVVVGGAASNRFALYDWQYAANQAARIEGPILARYRDAPLRSLTVATDDVRFWRWTLTADDKAPMLEFLLRRPGLPVRVVERRGLTAATAAHDPADVVLDADAGFAPLAATP